MGTVMMIAALVCFNPQVKANSRLDELGKRDSELQLLSFAPAQ